MKRPPHDPVDNVLTFTPICPVAGVHSKYAAALVLPLLNYYLKDLNMLKCILDDDKNKDGLYYINMPLKIVLSENIYNIEDSVIVITAINSKQVVRAIISKSIRDIIIPANLI